ncbi:MAG: 116 kDa U5 small nuclear ribonucleoprotein component [archaeon]|nr:116 kDa U5 small nuclear ribonucleoprotein component [archaeon]
MDEKNYDEFGHYIGPELPEINSDDYDEDSNENSSQIDQNENQNENINPNEQNVPNSEMVIEENQNLFSKISAENSYAVTLHEDKKFYPSADEVFPGVENLVMEEDSQPITEPIIPPPKKNTFDLYEKEIPTTSFNFDFLSSLMNYPSLIRNIAVAGSLHHGKTSLMDLFIQITHLNKNSIVKNNKCNNPYMNKEVTYNDTAFTPNIFKEEKYLDNRTDEQKRKISIKSSPISLILENSKGKSFLFNFIDTPGHSNFFDEVQSAFRLCDGVLIIVDVLEGITKQTEKIIQLAIKENLDIILVLNKIDRLILELKLPPNDAYFKIKNTIDDFNNVLTNFSFLAVEKENIKFVHPSKGNVIFASTLYGVCFTLQSFASMLYQLKSNSKFDYLFADYNKFSRYLYGDIYFNSTNRTFSKTNTSNEQKRTFVAFILEPIYKIFGLSLTEDKENLKDILSELGIGLKDSEYKMDPKPLLKTISYKFLGHYSSLVDSCIEHIIDSNEGNKIKVRTLYTGNKNTSIYKQISKCEEKGPLLCVVYKLYHNEDHSSFYLFGRILSGNINEGDKLKIMGENYNLIEKEDMTIQKLSHIYINQTKYKIKISKVPLGNFVLIEGIDISMSKNLTITKGEENNSILNELEIFRPILFDYSYFKVSVEPLNPSDLPKMLEGLRKINKSYPAAKTKVEESGENIILGTGELYMDSILFDLRNIYSEIEIKVSDPVVVFAETVSETSAFKSNVLSRNEKNSISMIAEPIEKNIIMDLENYRIDTLMKKEIKNNKNLNIDENSLDKDKMLQKILIENYKWDKLTAKSLWAFTPSTIDLNQKGNSLSYSENMLIDYTLPTETNSLELNSIKTDIIQGFNWACREGPLIGEPIKNTKFKILSASISSENLFKGSGQIIPMIRRACYASYLSASPKLMEPFLISEIQCPLDCLEAVNAILMRRRGHVNKEKPLSGTPFYVIEAMLPALDSFGFETDLRTTTAGQAFCMCWFDGYKVMDGDPLDRTIKIKTLEPSSILELPREAMIKTRRRKGMIEEVNLENYFDEDIIKGMKTDNIFKNYFGN